MTNMMKMQDDMNMGEVSPPKPACRRDEQVRHEAQVAEIVDLVAPIFALSPDETLRPGRRRAASLIRARHIIIYLAHTNLGLSNVDIAAQMSTSRTSIAYACQRIEDARESATFDAIIAAWETALAARLAQRRRGRRHV